MSHPDPNHDPENIKNEDDMYLSPLERLERDLEALDIDFNHENARESNDIEFDEDDYDRRREIDSDESYVDMLARVMPRK